MKKKLNKLISVLIAITLFSSLASAYYGFYENDNRCEYDFQDTLDSCILEVKFCMKYADESAKSFDEYLWKGDLCRMSYSKCKRETVRKRDLCKHPPYYEFKPYYKYKKFTYTPTYHKIRHPYERNCRILYLPDDKNNNCRGIKLCGSIDLKLFETFTECQEVLLKFKDP